MAGLKSKNGKPARKSTRSSAKAVPHSRRVTEAQLEAGRQSIVSLLTTALRERGHSNGVDTAR